MYSLAVEVVQRIEEIQRNGVALIFQKTISSRLLLVLHDDYIYIRMHLSVYKYIYIYIDIYIYFNK